MSKHSFHATFFSLSDSSHLFQGLSPRKGSSAWIWFVHPFACTLPTVRNSKTAPPSHPPFTPLSLPHQKFTYRTAVACFSRNNSSLTQAYSFWVDSWASESCLTIRNKGLLRAATPCLWPVLHELFSSTAINYFVHQIFPTFFSYIQGGLLSSKIQATLCDYDMSGDSYQWTLCPRLLHPRTAQLRMPPIQYHYSVECHLYNATTARRFTFPCHMGDGYHLGLSPCTLYSK